MAGCGGVSGIPRRPHEQGTDKNRPDGDGAGAGCSLDAYIAAAYSVPVLAAEEERRLAIRYHEKNDVEVARKLALHNLRFVIQVARGYLGLRPRAGATWCREGNIGLLKAIKRFDPAIGRAPCVVRGALDTGRDTRVHHPQLAHRQGGDDQGAEKTVLQPARQEKSASAG